MQHFCCRFASICLDRDLQTAKTLDSLLGLGLCISHKFVLKGHVMKGTDCFMDAKMIAASTFLVFCFIGKMEFALSCLLSFFFFLYNTEAKSSSPLPHRYPWRSPRPLTPHAPMLSSTLLSTYAPLHKRLINCILDRFSFFTPLSPFHLLLSLHPNPS